MRSGGNSVSASVVEKITVLGVNVGRPAFVTSSYIMIKEMTVKIEMRMKCGQWSCQNGGVAKVVE